MPSTRNLNLGCNIDANRYYGCVGAWSDVAKGFGSWFYPAGTSGGFTADGYPTGSGAQALNGMSGCPSGTYSLSWQGSATIAVKWATLGPVTKDATGTSTATVTVANANSQILLTATGLNPADPLRNLHLYQPGMGPLSPPFAPAFTKWLAPFSVLRVIDWAGVNIVKTTVSTTTMPSQMQWASRVQPTSWDQTNEGGVAYEYFFALCQQTKCIPWVNIPLIASDDFAAQLAALVATYNFPTVYVELSNEVWNSSFGQWTQNYVSANTFGVTLGSSDPNIRARQNYAERARHIGYIFKSALGSKCKMVLAGQLVNPAVIADGLAWIAAKYGDVSESFDAISPATYFPSQTPPVGQTMAQIASACSAYIANEMTAGLNGHQVLSSKYGLPIVCYEGGQSLQSWNNPLGSAADLPAAIQTDASMGSLYQTWLGVCQAMGVTLQMHNSFIAPPGRSWLGALQANVFDTPGVKWQTLANFAALPMMPPTAPSTTPPPVQLPPTAAGTLTLNGKTYNVVAQ